MTDDFDYYIIGSTYPDNVPLLCVDDGIDASSVSFLSWYEPLAIKDYVARVRFGKPFLSKPRLADALSLDGTCNVFSKKIYDVLSKHNIKGLQLVPTIISDNNGNTFDNFWIANVYQKMAFFDEEETEFAGISEFTGGWEDIEKIALDEKLLEKVPLKERLVFVSKEKISLVFYHKTVVDIIMSVEPEGVVFTSVDEWES